MNSYYSTLTEKNPKIPKQHKIFFRVNKQIYLIAFDQCIFMTLALCY